jgi:ABC-type anion transport system duplicated permease subunit
MMSMAGGWFFLMVSEAFQLGAKDFRLPGLGSYMSVAAARGDGAAMVWAVCAMETIVLAMPQESCERMFEVFVSWSRYGDLFAYDEAAKRFSAQ